MGWTKFPFYESGQEDIGPGLLTTQMWVCSDQWLIASMKCIVVGTSAGVVCSVHCAVCSELPFTDENFAFQI